LSFILIASYSITGVHQLRQTADRFAWRWIKGSGIQQFSQSACQWDVAFKWCSKWPWQW
jgi:hypothetical protein